MADDFMNINFGALCEVDHKSHTAQHSAELQFYGQRAGLSSNFYSNNLKAQTNVAKGIQNGIAARNKIISDPKTSTAERQRLQKLNSKAHKDLNRLEKKMTPYRDRQATQDGVVFTADKLLGMHGQPSGLPQWVQIQGGALTSANPMNDGTFDNEAFDTGSRFYDPSDPHKENQH